MSPDQKTLLVTGASSGMGRAICTEMLSEGHLVIGIARDFSKFPCENPNFTPVSIDLGNLDRLPGQLKKLPDAIGELDALVLCAGQGMYGTLEQCSYEQIRNLVDLNFTSQLFMIRHFLPAFRARGQGDIILMGSEAGLQGKRKLSVYCGTKGALRIFAQSLRDEVCVSGIRVTLLSPGMVNTAFFDKLEFSPGIDESNYIDPHDVAEAVSMVLRMRPGTVMDEIVISPLRKVVKFGKPEAKDGKPKPAVGKGWFLKR